ncbi:MAG: HAD-IB family phosphatase [Thermoplasmata archaeon]
MASFAVPRYSGPAQSVVVSDFDGTLTSYDLGTMVLEQFGAPGWEHFDELFEAGKITLGDCLREQTALIRASSPAEILRYLLPFSEFRPGMKPLLDECRRGGSKFVVASAGIDFCIRQVFRREGLSIPPLCCPVTKSTAQGFRIKMPRTASLGDGASVRFSSGENFKKSLVAAHQARGRSVTFLGDGAADIAPASVADKVFAIDRSPLAIACVQRGIPCTRIRSLDPVASFMRGQSLRYWTHADQ